MSTPIYDAQPTVQVTNVHENTAQELIHITVDRLKLVLVEHKDGFERKREWHTPLGLFLTLVLVFLTASFKDGWGFKADTWAAFFLLLTLASAGWLARSGYRAIKSATIDDVILKLKKNG